MTNRLEWEVIKVTPTFYKFIYFYYSAIVIQPVYEIENLEAYNLLKITVLLNLMYVYNQYKTKNKNIKISFGHMLANADGTLIKPLAYFVAL